MNRTSQTLVEQMKISDIEIDNRKDLLDLAPEDVEVLTKYKSLIEGKIEEIVEIFYDIQTKVDEISLLIGDADTLMRLQNALRKYIIDLFSGYYDTEYVNNRLRIGLVHKRIGVEPKLYLAAVRVLKNILLNILKISIKNKEDFYKVESALDKLLNFDITLVFDTYIGSLVGEIETAKERAETYAKSLEDKVQERTKQLEELSRVDPLTSIYNQRAMYDYLRHQLMAVKRNKMNLSLIYFDIDKFKTINDKEGHVKGDEVLKKVGEILKSSVREGDIPCRYGGDEFTVILPNCDIKNAKIVCEKIIKNFAEIYPKYYLSFGVSQTGTEVYPDIEELIKNADEKMYEAKAESGFKIC